MVYFKNADITIYNRHIDKITGYDKYQRTVIQGVNWQGKRSATIDTTNGLLIADSILVFADKLSGYVTPRAFKLLTDIARPNYFTYAIGDKIVKGNLTYEVVKIADLEKNYDNVITIMSVRELSSHMELEGK